MMLLMHAWTAFPALVLTMTAVWGILLYIAWKVVQISRGA
jgi:hypothetical protein